MKRWTLAISVVGLLFGAAPGLAQETGPQIEIAGTTNPKEMGQYVRAALEEMMTGMKTVAKLQEAARRESDDEMIRCVQVKLSNIRALMMVSERANGAMKEAQSTSNPQRAEHEFRKIVVSLAKVRQFVAEADACMGDAGSAPGTSDVQVSQSGLTEGDDSEALDDYFLVVGVDPADVSPFN